VDLEFPPTSSHIPTPREWCTSPLASPTTYVPPASERSETFLLIKTPHFLFLQHAIDIAKESFLELKDVERERISLEVHVLLKNQQARRTAEIGRTAWSLVVASLARFEILEIRVAPAPPNAKIETGSQSSSIGPPPYATEKSSNLYSDSQSSLSPYRPQTTSSQSSSSSFATRVVDLLTPKSSRSHLSQSYHQF